jgi:hypothetical protein
MTSYDIRRHVRREDPVEVAQALGEQPRSATGQFVPMLPPFERKQRAQHPMHEPCRCGRRRGMHRWGDEACPNPNWRPGNGSAQFVARCFARP